MMDELLESGSSVRKSERHAKKLKQSKGRCHSSFRNVFFLHRNLVGPSEVEMPNSCLRVYNFLYPQDIETPALLPLAFPGVVVMAWRKPEVLLLLLCASPRASAS
ncbi:hypothetical protein TNCV_2025431 [Trichonephila clavipes]|nr:hypothetical protein TNCV_2025431 [Trichonephila clavipes]